MEPVLDARHSYLDLPQVCFEPCAPTPVKAPQWIAFNEPLTRHLGLSNSQTEGDTGLAIFSGNQLPSWAKPVAQAYAGHQFGHFVPRLGDGRAILLAELRAEDHECVDLQLKGAGRTPFSRGGDGRSPLGPVLREYLVSEYMAAVGIPTTRALAAVASGEWVQREEPEPGAILARVASSHLRIGSLQYLLAMGDLDALEALVAYTIARHYPALKNIADEGKRTLALLDAVIECQVKLVAQWMGVGFIHGVMNTDNVSLSGETLDYGPCAFMDSYRADQVFSFIDKRGRYAYGQQPSILHWNLARLAEALLPLIDNHKDTAIAQATTLVDAIPQRFTKAWLEVMGHKLGLLSPSLADKALIEQLLTCFEQQQTDFTLGFAHLSGELDNQREPQAVFPPSENFLAWRQAWQGRIDEQGIALAKVRSHMADHNPRRIPRNHQIQQVIDAAYQEGDLRPFHALHQALQRPFDSASQFAPFDSPPSDNEAIRNTFCGT